MKPKQIAIAFDQFLNTLLAGFADETLSARAWRMQYKKRRWMLVRMIIDTIFFWQDEHCLQAFLSERERKHLPPEYSPT